MNPPGLTTISLNCYQCQQRLRYCSTGVNDFVDKVLVTGVTNNIDNIGLIEH
jgi:hypothetical protein